MSLGLFLKANGSRSGQSEGISLRMMERQIDHEVELGVVIGREGANIRPEDALKHLAGYALALEIPPHGKGGRGLRKSGETHTGLGPSRGTAHEIPHPMHLELPP